MAVAKITNEVKLAIERKTAKTLPDQPTARGYSAETIRNTLYRWLSDNTNSLFAELDRIVDEINAQVDNVTDGTTDITYDNASSGLTAATIQAAIDELDSIIDNILSGVTNITYNNSISGLIATTLKAAIDELDSEIDKIKSGATVVAEATKATNDSDDNEIKTTYEKLANKRTSWNSTPSNTSYPSEKLTKDSLDLKVDKATTLLGLDLANDIARADFVAALGNATALLSGLLSPEDYSLLVTLRAMLGEEADVDTFVNTFNEILAIFSNYPEGADLVTVLAGKVDKVAGKSLSTNDYDNTDKGKVSYLPSNFNTYMGNYYTKPQIDLLIDQLTTAYGLTEVEITELAHNATLNLSEITPYDYITLYLKHSDTHFIFDGKLIDPALFANIGDMIQLNAWEDGTQLSYGKLFRTYSNLLQFHASDGLDTLVVKGYKKEAISSDLVKTEHSGTNYLDETGSVKGALEALDVEIETKEDKSNKIIAWGTPTDTQYPSAKLAKDSLDLKEDLANKATDFSVVNDTKYPTTKAVDDTYATKTALAIKADVAVVNEINREQDYRIATIEEAYRKSQNGELTATKSGTDIISLGKDVAPAPLQVKVDGGLIPALENLVNGSFSTSTGWSAVRGNLSVSNNELKLTNTGITDFRVRNNDLLLANNVYYISSQIKETHSTSLRYFIGSSSGSVYSSVVSIDSSTFVTSKQVLLPTTDGYLTFQGGPTGSSVVGETIVLKNTHVFNLTTSHGVTATSGTAYDNAVADIEAMLALNGGYITSTPIHAVGMNKRVRSVGKNLFDYTILYNELKVVSPNNVSYATIGGKNAIRLINHSYFRTRVYLKLGYKEKTAYTITYSIYQEGSTFGFAPRFYYTDGTQVSVPDGGQNAWYTYSATSDPARTLLGIGYTYGTGGTASYIAIDNFQLELGSTATSYAPYANTDLYLQANKVGYKLPNGVADTIEYRNGKYYYVQRVQTYALKASDIVSIQTFPTNNDIVSISKPLDSIHYGNITAFGTTAQGLRVVGFLTGNWADSTSAVGIVYNASNANYGLIVAKGTYATLAQAQTALAGTVIYYQLATPVETEILSLGNAQGLAGGTVYIDDMMADSNLYTSKYDIENTAYPIKSLDRIVKINADGSQTELAVSSAIIAGDGLSFTHPSLVANDIVWISYYYNVANLFKSNTFVTYYDNPFIAVQPNGTPRRIVFAVDNSGVVNVSSQAV